MADGKFTKYVAGFAFTPSLEEVLLVEKRKPAWQAGKYNGVGGKVEPGESSATAMVREFTEETGLTVTGWEIFCRLFFAGEAQVNFYRATAVGLSLATERNDVGERLRLLPARNLPPNVIANLQWLVPFALAWGAYDPIIVVEHTPGGVRRVA
jgi:8-oxo-dGTP diphosphatase